jgi:hypothetical protein
MFKVSKKCHQDFSLLHTYYNCYTSLFWVKSGGKWLTYSMLHPFVSCDYGQGSSSMVIYSEKWFVMNWSLENKKLDVMHFSNNEMIINEIKIFFGFKQR